MGIVHQRLAVGKEQLPPLQRLGRHDLHRIHGAKLADLHISVPIQLLQRQVRVQLQIQTHCTAAAAALDPCVKRHGDLFRLGTELQHAAHHLVRFDSLKRQVHGAPVALAMQPLQGRATLQSVHRQLRCGQPNSQAPWGIFLILQERQQHQGLGLPLRRKDGQSRLPIRQQSILRRTAKGRGKIVFRNRINALIHTVVIWCLVPGIGFHLRLTALLGIVKGQEYPATGFATASDQRRHAPSADIQLHILDHCTQVIPCAGDNALRCVPHRQNAAFLIQHRLLQNGIIGRNGAILQLHHAVPNSALLQGHTHRFFQVRRVTGCKHTAVTPILAVNLQVGEDPLLIPPQQPLLHPPHAKRRQQRLNIGARHGHGGDHIRKRIIKLIVEHRAQIPFKPLFLHQNQRVIVCLFRQSAQIRQLGNRLGVQHPPGFLFILAVVDHFQIAGVAGKRQL